MAKERLNLNLSSDGKILLAALGLYYGISDSSAVEVLLREKSEMLYKTLYPGMDIVQAATQFIKEKRPEE